jgi:hypothetical protein
MSFIDVPNVLGVPPLASYAPNNVALLVADVVSAIFNFLAPQWGIFLDGVNVLDYDNQVSFSFRKDWSVATYPVEQGSFQTYDKVEQPGEIRCRFSTGGSTINRQLMLSTLQAAMTTTLTYDVLTPETTYLSYNFTHMDYDRDAESAGMLVVDVWLKEVIQTATAQFQSTANPTVAGAVGGGNVQTSQPSTGLSSAVSGGFL